MEVSDLLRQPHLAFVSESENIYQAGPGEAIEENSGNRKSIAGVATAAIAQGALVAEALGLPFVYVRSSPKDHGREI